MTLVKKIKTHEATTDRPLYVFVVNNCLHGTNIISDSYLWGSENCISKFILHLGLNISIRLNEMLLDAFVIVFSPHRPFTKLLLARGIISASIFSENVEGMNLKFAEEME